MKALIAMSGGVDSSVAAYLMMDEGYSCIGINFKMFDKANPIFGFKPTDGERDAEDARSVCRKMGMEFILRDASRDFENHVIRSFVDTYEKGGTPNPCVQCNRHIKFKLLLDAARELGCDVIATGHYAKIGHDEASGRYFIERADDLTKDQSYVLYPLTQEQLSHTVFPLGGITKEQARIIAEEKGFVTARKSDSQDICFVHSGDYISFIKDYTGRVYPEGDFVDLDGNVLGRHKGIINYTIGQRRGLYIATGQRIYAKSKNVDSNTVVLSDDEGLYEKEVIAEDFNFMGATDFKTPTPCTAKIRYKHREQPGLIEQIGENRVRMIFNTPQRAAAKGQSLVVYSGDKVLGGGIIL